MSPPTTTVSRRHFSLLFGAGLTTGIATAGEAAPDFNGTWTGILELGSQRLRLQVFIASDDSATLVSLDQDAQPVAGRVTRKGDRLEIAFKKLHGEFSGRAASPDRIEGVWNQAGELPLVLMRGEEGLNQPAPVIAAMTQDELTSLRMTAGSPALAAAAARRGSPAQHWVTGQRELGSNVRATNDDVWHFGSVTKSITATLVARLVDAGALNWSDTVGSLLGAAIPEMRDAYRSVTFRHLLSHRSGIPGDISILKLLGYVLHDSSDVIRARRKYAASALGMEPLGAKEETFAYANNGYVVAGAMLEAKLGRSWEDLVREHVYQPLGLESAGFGPPGHGGKVDQPVGHLDDLELKVLKLFGGSALKPAPPDDAQSDNPVPLGPAGRAHMSLDDMLKFLTVHRDRTSFLSAASWDALHTPPFGGNYAMGWIVEPDGSLWHNGSNNRWYAEVTFNAATGVVACAVANEARVKARQVVGRSLLSATRAV